MAAATAGTSYCRTEMICAAASDSGQEAPRWQLVLSALAAPPGGQMVVSGTAQRP
jgi:hypothetical protein